MAANTKPVSLSIPISLANKIEAFAREMNFKLEQSESISFYYVQFLTEAVERTEAMNGGSLSPD
jgi:hypothetical protein